MTPLQWSHLTEKSTLHIGFHMESKDTTQVVLLTGGSSGIGAATALLLAKEGMKVYATSRSGKAPSHQLIVPMVMDINDEKSVEDGVKAILEAEGRIDSLVCNAGNGIGGPVECTSDEEARYQFETCFFGTMKTIRAVLPHMRERKCGRIITVTSVAAVIPIPYQAYYSSVKAALLMLTRALSLEVKPFGIQCCSILPGDTKTSFTAARKKIAHVDEAYRETMERSVGKMEKDEQNGMSPDVIGRAIVRQLKRRRMRPTVTPRLDYRFIYILSRLLPERLMKWVVGLLYA